MDCKDVAGRLEDYFTEALDETSRGAIQAHWEACAACREEAEGIQGIWTNLELVRVPSPSAGGRQRFDLMLTSYQRGLEDGRSRAGWRRLLGGWLGSPAWGGHALAHAVWLVVFLVVGLALGSRFTDRQTPTNLAVLESEVRSLKQLIALSMLEQGSASKRLLGVSYTAQIDEPDAEVVSRLLDTMDSDSSVNVRLAAVEVLHHFGGDAAVRDHVLLSLPRQTSPLVQISMIDLLVETGERRSVPLFEELSANESVHEAVRERAAWGLLAFG
jgi:hypothetical protein